MSFKKSQMVDNASLRKKLLSGRLQMMQLVACQCGVFVSSQREAINECAST